MLYRVIRYADDRYIRFVTYRYCLRPNWLIEPTVEG